jgi:hydrogenase maturation protease
VVERSGTPPPPPAAPVLVIGIGNALRHDDGAGPLLARRLCSRAAASGIAVRELEGETLTLLDMWAGARAVVLIDATRSGAAPGTIHRFDASSRPLPSALRGSSSTHAVGVAEAIELARALGTLPGCVLVLAVEGRRFDAGSGLSREVEAALEDLSEAVLGAARELALLRGAGAAPEPTACSER